MSIELISKLIDRLIQLINQRATQRRNLFNDFVQPVYKSFEELHASYAESFKQYRHELMDGPGPLPINHPVFEHIAVDAMYEGVTMRDRVRTFYEGMRKADVGNESIRCFAAALYDYLTLGIDIKRFSPPGKIVESLLHVDMARNIPRALLEADLSEWIAKMPSLPREQACQVLDSVFKRLQNRHATVLSAYEKLKSELLS